MNQNQIKDELKEKRHWSLPFDSAQDRGYLSLDISLRLALRRCTSTSSA